MPASRDRSSGSVFALLSAISRAVMTVMPIGASSRSCGNRVAVTTRAGSSSPSASASDENKTIEAAAKKLFKSSSRPASPQARTGCERSAGRARRFATPRGIRPSSEAGLRACGIRRITFPRAALAVAGPACRHRTPEYGRV